VASEEIGEGESAVMIPLLLDSGRTVRAKVSRDAALLDAIDAVAKERGLSRSAFLASAARERIMTGHSGVPPDGARLLGERVGVEASPVPPALRRGAFALAAGHENGYSPATLLAPAFISPARI
jgi:hypothetical protein